MLDQNKHFLKAKHHILVQYCELSEIPTVEVMKILTQNFRLSLKEKMLLWLLCKGSNNQDCFTKFIKGLKKKKRQNLIHKYIHAKTCSGSYSRSTFDRRNDQELLSQKDSFLTQHFNVSALQQQHCNNRHKSKHSLKWCRFA